MIINKNISDKTFFLLTNYNDPNLCQFHFSLSKSNAISFKKFVFSAQFQQKIKKVTSSIVDMVMVAICYKLSLVKVLNFQSVPSKSGVFLYIFKKIGFNALEKFIQGDRGFIVENVHILYMYIYIISFVLAEKIPSVPPGNVISKQNL